jgi:activator of HSP90 ATPase
MGGALSVAGLGARPASLRAASGDEISRTEESIHQERTFAAERARVYAALTVERQFDQIVQFSGVRQGDGTGKAQHPTRLSAQVGGTFSLFDGYILGRQLALVPDSLIVQAWRVLNWPAGVYSIARFELTGSAHVTRLVFDHTGFPKGDAEHLASGWQAHYWDPLARLLA